MIKKVLLSIAISMAACSTAAATSDTYPSRSISLLVGFAAGGPTDQAARIVGEALSEELGQAVIVINKPGANSTISVREFATAKPDGYQLLLASNGILTVAGARYESLPFDVEKDFMPVGSVAGYSHVLAVPTDKPFDDLSGLLKYQQELGRPTAIGSVGNVDELTIALFRKLSTLDFESIPYKGQSAVVSDLVAGRLDMSFLSPTVAKPLVESGRLKAIAVTGGQRSLVMPDVATMDEAGLTGFNVEIWNALLAAPGTDPSIIKRLSDGLKAALSRQQTKDRLAQAGLMAVIDSPQELAAKIKNEGQAWLQLVEEENLPRIPF